MASDFKLISYQKKDHLHLKLRGEFDGSSALELINALKQKSTNLHGILVDTNDLKVIHSFGREVFEKKIRATQRRCLRMIFTGKYKHLFET